MSAKRPVIMWFRQDLRLADNPALCAAAEHGGPVIPLFILDETPPLRPLGGAGRWWLQQSLGRLAGALAKVGAPLVLRRGPAGAMLASLIAETGAGVVYWSRLYDAASIARDTAIKTELARRGVEARSFNAALLNEPWEIRTGAGGSYKVFTPYWRAARARADEGPGPLSAPVRLPALAQAPAGEALRDWGLYRAAPDWAQGFSQWRPGETGAHAALDAFLESGVATYPEDRDRPAVAGTSRLSPHLHFGEIGPRQILAAACIARRKSCVSERGTEVFLKELGWREFNHHLLFHHPALPRENFNPAFDPLPWRTDREGLQAWRRGVTGYPIVDAAMRELWTTGWMHNRARMIVASFLVKDLMIDWREGEAWFWDTLVDADVANNAGNWQWVAGSGADAAPYFRVFNPIIQGMKFDPRGEYVRRWAPELARLPDSMIHQPWKADASTLSRAGVSLGRTYPSPIVDHARARERALAAYQKLRA